MLKSIDPAFVKSGVEILRKLKNSRIKNIEKDQVKESDFIIKDTLQLWGLNRVHGSPLDSGVIGRVVTYGSGGQTTPIDSFWKCDTGAVIVKTVSGSYYKLGIPNLGFTLKHTDLMEELGLTSLDSK